MPTHRKPSRVPHARVASRLVVGLLCGGAVATAALTGPSDASSDASKSFHPTADETVAAAVTGHGTDHGRQADRATRSLTRPDPSTDKLASSAVNALTSPPAGGLTSPPASATETAPTPPAQTVPVAPPAAAPPAAAPAPAAAAPAPVVPPAPAAPPALPSIPGLTATQMTNARTIVTVGQQMGVPVRGQVIAVATALQESQLYNLTTAVDHDSLGLFQQRPASGWGTPDELTDPAYEAKAFYRVLMQDTSDWGCLTCAAQRVQVSAYPGAYAKHEALATQIVNALR